MEAEKAKVKPPFTRYLVQGILIYVMLKSVSRETVPLEQKMLHLGWKTAIWTRNASIKAVELLETAYLKSAGY